MANILDAYGRKLSPEARLHFEVTRSDHSFYESTDIAVVLGDDNAPGKPIRSLSLKLLQHQEQTNALVPTEPTQVARVVFGSDEDVHFFRSESEVRFTVVEKSRDWCYLLADELDGQIQRVLSRGFKWLPIRIIERLLPFLIMAGAMAWSFGPLFAQKHQVSSSEIAKMSLDQRTVEILTILSSQNAKLGWRIPIAFILIFLGMALIEIKPLSWLWRRVYAPTFYWGDMVATKDRFDRLLANVKWTVVAGFVVSVIASFAYAWIGTH